MSFFVQPVCSKSSPKIGTSSSTQVGDPSNSFICRWAKPTTATSLIKISRFLSLSKGSEVLLVGVVVSVGLAGRTEVPDVLDRGAPLLAGLPDRLDAHAHPHVGGVALEDQVQERDVGAV